ncbi:DoxX family protein [Thermosynechococcaceae cyanobacterium BACA0444]|uniref:DoxX family protein n=1 Tax=Pseudocalidococcus azoricus BACA0444 TaxID=2918990 RepID=A0AAE4FS17_9CYAN|nr:DoxX family protein [Pseudocalidococcus azoricus]MDS3860708.1 DoxX family protein [Pseudocalidococcus azoricus BACA0444]
MNISQQLGRWSVALLQTRFTPSYGSQAGWTILRIVAGLVMIHNGLDKLADIESFSAAYVEVIGLPFPIFFSYVAALTELLAAPLLALGFLARPAALGLFSTMLVAMYHHVLVAGFSIPYLELSMLYAAVFLFFLLNGAGLFSVDAFLAGKFSSFMAGQSQDVPQAEPVALAEQSRTI